MATIQAYQRFRPMREGDPGFRGKSARRYINPITGETISYRENKQLRLQAGITGRERPLVFAREEIKEEIINHYKEAQRLTLTNTQIARSADFQIMLAALQDNTGEYKNDQGKTVWSSNSPKAWALVQLGLRQPEWTWAVGETPEL